MAIAENHTAHDQNHGKSHGDREYVIILQRQEMAQLVTPTSTNFGFEALDQLRDLCP